MTRRALQPADLATLSGCAAELAEAFVSLSGDIALVIDDLGVIQSVAQSPTAPIVTHASGWVGRRWIETVSGDTRRKIDLMLTDLRSTGVARRREINVAGESSADVPVAFSALRLGKNGPVLAVGKDLRAVSSIQQRFLDAQQELERGYWRARQAESRYRLLFQVATDAVLTVDAHSLRVIEANHAAANLLGAGTALAGRPTTQLFDPSSREALQELLLKSCSLGKPAEIHVRMPKTQALAAVSATPFRASDGLRLLLRVRFAAGPEAVGADMHKTLALLVDSTRDGVVVTDSSGRIVIANPAFLAMLQGPVEEQTRSRHIGDWVGRIDADVSALLAGAHEHGIAHLVRSSLRRHGGSSIDVDVTAALLAEGEQECFGFTIRACEPKTDPQVGWAHEIARLDARVGQVPLAQILAESQRLIERRCVAGAMSRTQGNAAAAAGLLGISVAELLQTLARDDTAGASVAAAQG